MKLKNSFHISKIQFLILLALFIAGVVLFFGLMATSPTPQKEAIEVQEIIEPNMIIEEETASAPDQNGFLPPIVDFKDRITKKPFEIFITPQTSPVQPDPFTGFHTGTDFEILPGELNVEIPIRAICHGEIIQKRQIGGYGSVIIQECMLDEQPITVLYGHLSFDTRFTRDVGEYLLPGDSLAILGDDKSAETGNARKHLHLGIHKGTEIDVRGYVNTKNELFNWINFENRISKYTQ